jgi:hypothetical protein
MTHRSRLKLASLAFAVLWTLWMIWSLSPLHPREIGLLVASGLLAGLAWHWLYASARTELCATARGFRARRACASWARGRRLLPSLWI